MKVYFLQQFHSKLLRINFDFLQLEYVAVDL
jgi:hypothetical protein